MAQTGFTPISTYYTTTASAVPTAANLIAGELALNINTADGKLFYKDSAGVVQVLATKASASGSFTNLAYTGTLTGGTGVVNLGSGQFYKDASGNIGVGTTNPITIAGYTIQTLNNGTTGSGTYYQQAGTSIGRVLVTSSQMFVGTNGAYPLLFTTNAAEAMRITSAGFVGIGSTAPVSKLEVDGTTSINGSNATYVGTVQINESVASAQAVGGLEFKSASFGSGYGWKIASLDSSGAQLTFNTRQNSATWSEQMRIDSSGNLLVGTTNTDPVSNSVNGVSISQSGFKLRTPTNTNTWGLDATSGNHIRFFTSGVTAAGIISSTGSITTYGTTSDKRLKTDLGLSTDTSIIDNTEIHNYSWNSDGTLDRGVFAQDAHKIKPSAICEGTDNADGTIEVPWQVDYSKYVPDLIVYCQQLKKRIDQLEAQLGK